MTPPDVEIEVLAEHELQPVFVEHARPGALTDASTTEVVTNSPLATSALVDAARGRTRLVAHRLRTHARRHQGAPNPRHNSVVRRFVWEDATTLVDRFRLPPTAPEPDFGALRFVGSQLSVDPDHHDYRVSARLRVPRTMGAHPVWLWIEPWWGTRSVIGVELRSKHRPHYSRRYFDAAHEALRHLVERVGAPISPRSVRPPRRPIRSGQLRYASGRAPTTLARSITRWSGK